jgi:apolipoprotein N-acyltransferase
VKFPKLKLKKFNLPGPLQKIAASTVGGIFLALSFPPFNLTILSFFFGFALILFASKDEPVYSLPAVVFFYGSLCIWIYSFGFFAYIAFLIAIAMITYSLIFLLRQILDFVNYPLLVFPFFVVIMELLSELIPVAGFPWLPLGLPFAQYKMFSGLISIIGIHGMSFLAVFITLLFYKIFKSDDKTTYIKFFVGVVSILILTNILNVGEGKANSVTSIQPGKLNNPTLRTLTILSTLDKSDILVLPESAIREFPYGDLEKSMKEKLNPGGVGVANLSITDKSSVKRKTRFAQIAKKEHQFNVNLTIFEGKKKLEYKTKLVPFGEYVPGEFFIGWLPIFDEIYPRFSNSKTPVKGSIDKVSTSICYEVAFSNYVSNRISNKNVAHLVTTNNTSYEVGGIANIKQQLTHSRARAIENGITVVQSAIGGESAIIAPTGEVKKSFKKGKIGFLAGQTYGKRHFIGLKGTVYSYIYKYQLIAYLLGLTVVLFIRKRTGNGRI